MSKSERDDLVRLRQTKQKRVIPAKAYCPGLPAEAIRHPRRLSACEREPARRQQRIERAWHVQGTGRLVQRLLRLAPPRAQRPQPGQPGTHRSHSQDTKALGRNPKACPKVRAELCDAGHKVSRKRVACLMHKGDIQGVGRRRDFTVTTERNTRQLAAPHLVNRQFHADGPDRLWAADMTYIPTWTGFL